MDPISLKSLINDMYEEFKNLKPNLNKIQKIMDSYSSLDSEWQKYAFGEKQEYGLLLEHLLNIIYCNF